MWASVRLKKLVSFQYTIVPYPVLEDGTALVVIDTRLALNAHGKRSKPRVLALFDPPRVHQPFLRRSGVLQPLKSVSLEDPLLQAIGENLESGRVIVGADSGFCVSLWEISRLASSVF